MSILCIFLYNSVSLIKKIHINLVIFYFGTPTLLPTPDSLPSDFIIRIKATALEAREQHNIPTKPPIHSNRIRANANYYICVYNCTTNHPPTHIPLTMTTTFLWQKYFHFRLLAFLSVRNTTFVLRQNPFLLPPFKNYTTSAALIPPHHHLKL